MKQALINRLFFKLRWRINNKHNTTKAKNLFHQSSVTVGKHTYGPIEVLYDNGRGRLTIGNYCSIAREVKFFLGGEHNYHRISTWPFQSKIYSGYRSLKRDENLDIIVEDDVWIGYDCIILPGARIGKGSVIGARSVVVGVIPPYSIYVANKIIKKRFDEEIIKKLKDIDFSKVEHKLGDAYQRYCTDCITEENVKEIMNSFV